MIYPCSNVINSSLFTTHGTIPRMSPCRAHRAGDRTFFRFPLTMTPPKMLSRFSRAASAATIQVRVPPGSTLSGSAWTWEAKHITIISRPDACTSTYTRNKGPFHSANVDSLIRSLLTPSRNAKFASGAHEKEKSRCFSDIPSPQQGQGTFHSGSFHDDIKSTYGIT